MFTYIYYLLLKYPHLTQFSATFNQIRQKKKKKKKKKKWEEGNNFGG